MGVVLSEVLGLHYQSYFNVQFMRGEKSIGYLLLQFAINQSTRDVNQLDLNIVLY